MLKVNAYAAEKKGGHLQPFSYELPEIGPEEVDIKVSYCGICHSDLSMIHNEWGMSSYPLVPGHEIVGEVIAKGKAAKNVQVGDKVGLGWFSSSCMSCHECLDGEHHLCSASEGTIVGRHGGFADYVRGHWSWAIPLPDQIDMSKAGPLLCGGITVFSPIVISGVRPTDHVGVIGIGGLGHMAIKFLKHWGCEVTAFTSNPEKTEQILNMGAHHVVNSGSTKELKNIRGKLQFVLNTTNVTLDWKAYLRTLSPKGIFHNVGVLLEPMAIPIFSLLDGENSVGGSSLGSPALTQTMMNFCVRHDIYPTVEEFPMSEVNEAIQYLEEGRARYRIVLKID